MIIYSGTKEEFTIIHIFPTAFLESEEKGEFFLSEVVS